MRELTNQLQELQEDLETEREARNKAEKLKRDLNEVGTVVEFSLLYMQAGLPGRPQQQFIFAGMNVVWGWGHS